MEGLRWCSYQGKEQGGEGHRAETSTCLCGTDLLSSQANYRRSLTTVREHEQWGSQGELQAENLWSSESRVVMNVRAWTLSRSAMARALCAW